jgi:hypothetical protein
MPLKMPGPMTAWERKITGRFSGHRPLQPQIRQTALGDRIEQIFLVVDIPVDGHDPAREVSQRLRSGCKWWRVSPALTAAAPL